MWNIFDCLGSDHNLPLMLWLFGAFLIGLVIGWWFWGRALSALRIEFNELKAKYDSLLKANGELKSAIEVKEGDLEKMSLELGTANTRIKDIEIEKGDLHTEMYKIKDALKLEEEAKLALSTQYDTLDGEFGTAKTRIGELEGEIKTLEGIKAKLEGEIGELNASLGSAKSDLESANVKIGGLETRVGDLEGNLGELNTSYGASMDAKAGLEGDLEAAKVKIGDLEGQIGDLQIKINDLEGVKANLEGQVGDLNASLGSAQSDLESANLKIGGLETQLGAGISSEEKATLEADLKKALDDVETLNINISDLEGANTGLEGDLRKANTRVEVLRGKIAGLEEELAGVKADLNTCNSEKATLLAAAAVEEEDDAVKVEQAQAEVKAAMSAMLASADEKDDLKVISGIGPFIEGKLNNLDIQTYRQISQFDDAMINKVTTAIEFFPGRIQRDEWVKQAKALVDGGGSLAAANPMDEDKAAKAATAKAELANVIGNTVSAATADEKDDLKVISGVGPFIEEKLNGLDIYTYKQVSEFDKKTVGLVEDAIEFFPGRIERDEWVKQALELYKRKKAAEAATTFQGFLGSKITTATADEKDDLKVISGVGPFIEEKMNGLGIFTYEQVSQFDSEIIEVVEDAIEFFPGRIQRDEWVKQALELFQAKS